MNRSQARRFTTNYIFPLLLFFAPIPPYAIYVYWSTSYKFSITDLILSFTIGAILWYSLETRILRQETEKLRKSSQQQSKIIKKVSMGTLILEIYRDMNSKRLQKQIIRAIENGEKILKENGGKFSEHDLYDYLGYLELLGIYIEKGILTKGLVWEMFSVDIIDTYENEEVSTYIKDSKEEDPTSYRYSEKLYRWMKQIDEEEVSS